MFDESDATQCLLKKLYTRQEVVKLKLKMDFLGLADLGMLGRARILGRIYFRRWPNSIGKRAKRAILHSRKKRENDRAARPDPSAGKKRPPPG